jgi:endonuclease/exonuclease/phosphatase family metal-dependent hydrolase
MKVLSWNVFHGRAVPGAGRDLREEYAALLAGWDWDVALLQEVPPWWPPALARACGAHQRTAPTSRNELLPLRRFLAERWPDLIKSNGGGADAILVRGRAITDHRTVTLRRRPERRVCHAVRLAGGLWCANLHAQVGSDERARADIARAAAATREWAGEEPAVLGGDFNVRAPQVPGFTHLGGHGVDHVFGRGVGPATAVATPARGRLSDHAPVLVTFAAPV